MVKNKSTVVKRGLSFHRQRQICNGLTRRTAIWLLCRRIVLSIRQQITLNYCRFVNLLLNIYINSPLSRSKWLSWIGPEETTERDFPYLRFSRCFSFCFSCMPPSQSLQPWAPQTRPAHHILLCWIFLRFQSNLLQRLSFPFEQEKYLISCQYCHQGLLHYPKACSTLLIEIISFSVRAVA